MFGLNNAYILDAVTPLKKLRKQEIIFMINQKIKILHTVVVFLSELPVSSLSVPTLTTTKSVYIHLECNKHFFLCQKYPVKN